METKYQSGDNLIKGTCQTMCPAAEIKLYENLFSYEMIWILSHYRREREGLLHCFEIQKHQEGSTRRPRADPELVVKSFSRPAAGRVHPFPGDVRPGPVLLRTIVYLFQRIVPRSDVDWLEVYNFVFDRLRAVRQDAVLQALQGPELITVLEHIVRFHVYSAYRLCEAPIEKFDAVINNQHLLECLKQLLRLYESVSGPHDNRAHFEAVYLLHNLGSTESMQHGLELPSFIRRIAVVQEAMVLNLMYLQGNFVRFLRHSLKLQSALCLCAVHRHFHHVHIHALHVMSVAYSSKACCYPLPKLQKLLCMERCQLLDLLQACGLVQEEHKRIVQDVNFLKSKFILPAKVDVCKQKEVESQLEKLDISFLLLGKVLDTS